MVVNEYQLDTGMHKALWVLMPYPILLKDTQFLMVSDPYDDVLTSRYARNVTAIGTPTVASLSNSWHEVTDTQTTPPP